MNSNNFSLKDFVVGQTVNHVWQVTIEQIDQFALLLLAKHDQLPAQQQYLLMKNCLNSLNNFQFFVGKKNHL